MKQYRKGDYARNYFKGMSFDEVMAIVKDYDYEYDEENECLVFGAPYGEEYVCYFDEGVCDDSYDDSYED